MNVGMLTGKRNQVRNHFKQREGNLTGEAREMVRENVEQLVSRLQERYGYTRDKAELEAIRLLDQYDHQVYELVRKLPGDIAPKVIRYPWATLATVLGLGLLVGFIVKPTNRCM